jgi:hypothetical protein
MNNDQNLPGLTATQRHDGWTAERQEAFLKALASCGCIREACATVGMSHVSAYRLRARPSAIAFRKAWDAALDCAMHRLEEAAVSRALNGVPRPVFYKGEQVGEWRHHDERLTMFLLRYRRPHRYCEQPDRPPPVLPPGMDDEPDEDEAMGRLDWLLDELTDYGDPPRLTRETLDPGCPAGEPSHAIDGGNFGNFETASASGDDASA